MTAAMVGGHGPACTARKDTERHSKEKKKREERADGSCGEEIKIH